MEKNLLRYFSLFLISFSITTFGQIKLGVKAYAAVNGSDLINQNFSDKDIYNFKITTGEALNNVNDEHNVFNADVINNKHEIKIQFDVKAGVNTDNYIVTGTDNSIAGTISEKQPYILSADLHEGENTIRILNKSTNEEIYKFNINYKNVKVNGLENIIKVGDISRLKAVIDGNEYDHVIWRSIDNNSIVINESGDVTAVQNGIASVTGTIYDKSEKNIMGTIDIDFNISGEGTSGWIKNGDKWYYIDSETKELKHGWVKDKEDWYYFNDDGTLYTGWLAQDGSWYYLKQTGNMAKGWFKDNGSWYYCDSDGKMKTGWFKDHGNWYYFNENGKMQTSDILIDGVLFKFNNHGELQLD